MARRSLLIRATASATLMALAAIGPVTAQNIGTVASSEPTLTGTPPGAGARALLLGTGVVQDERVSSSASGRGQLLFIDQTTLSLAPNTTIVLDQFVFNPNGSGQLGLQLTEGALRFIGGTLSREQEATVTTPTATIGIRGSSALIIHTANGGTIAVFLAGDQLCITTNSGQRSCTSRPGGVLTVEGYQGRVDRDYLAALLELIDGAPGGGGGTGLGSELEGDNPPNSRPLGTDGSQYDLEIFEDDFRADDSSEFVPVIETEQEVEDPDGDMVITDPVFPPIIP